MKRKVLLHLLISTFTLLLVPFLNIYAQTTPFFVMNLQDKDKYIKELNSWSGGLYTSVKSIHEASVDSMVIHDGIKFYKGYFVSRSWYFGMDEENNKLYYLKDGNKYMMLDFNIPPYQTFLGYVGGSSPVEITVWGTDSLRHYSFGEITISGSSEEAFTVERGRGFTFHRSGWQSHTGGDSESFSSFDQIRFNQNGDTIYNTTNWIPRISFSPEITTAEFVKTFSVNTNHDLNSQLSNSIPGINFNDSLFIRYFYTNGVDSTTTVVEKVSADKPKTNITVNLDSTKMKAGYKFKYRFTLRDKFYRPKLASQPSSIGFNTLSYDPSVGLIEDDPQIPVSIDLKSFPNPVSLNNNLGNQSATIRFNMPSAGHAKGTLYDILGRPVADILDDNFPVGENSIKFVTAGLTSGVYVFRLTTKSGTEHIKILVTK
ncbi:MAG: T9SS type A sorting domain-containing protein [Bacteroidetes bacterium]|nr:T9SS type A sorting domain-containing protein [Bacteroidota bacterium]